MILCSPSPGSRASDTITCTEVKGLHKTVFALGRIEVESAPPPSMLYPARRLERIDPRNPSTGARTSCRGMLRVVVWFRTPLLLVLQICASGDDIRVMAQYVAPVVWSMLPRRRTCRCCHRGSDSSRRWTYARSAAATFLMKAVPGVMTLLSKSGSRGMSLDLQPACAAISRRTFTASPERVRSALVGT